MLLRGCLTASILLAVGTRIAAAADHVLTLGGGPSPTYNQISLEKNVVYFEHVLAGLGLNAWPNDVYFGDGGSPYHTVKYEVPEDKKDVFRDQLAALVTFNADPQTRFEPTSLHHLQGPSTPASIRAWFSTTGKTLHAGDRLFIYFTGHGGDSPRADGERNTTLDLWDSSEMNVRDFARQLDTLDPDVDVTLIMVQCHSGGFANVLYKGGDPANGLSIYKRCGFFSTTAPRLASGCTPVVNEEDYQDFSTYFFAALLGKTRTGKSVDQPDYAHEGKTSLADAFTYVLLNDETIDIPMMTSDQFLRDFSRLRGDTGAPADLLPGDAPYPRVLAAATPAQRAALEGLSAQLHISGDDRIQQARALADDVAGQRNDLRRQTRRANTDFNGARRRLHDTLLFHYPELAIAWHPDTPEILADQGAAIQTFVQGQPDYQAYLAADKQRDGLGAKDDALELQWVKTQRFLERAKTVILAANLSQVAKPETLTAYHDLVARENRGLAE